MKITYKIVILLISVIVFSACSNKQNTQKEKINKLFSSVYLKNKGKDSIFYIDNKKDIEKFNNLYKDVDSLIENEKFYISYNCTFSKKTKKSFSSKLNNTFTSITGDFNIKECKKLDTPILIKKDQFQKEDKKYIFGSNLTTNEILNIYVNFTKFLYEYKLKDGKTISNKYNINIPFNLNNNSFEEKKLIIDNEFLLKITLKDSIEKMLKKNSIKTTNDIEKATVILEVENIAFGNNLTVDEIYHDLVFRENRDKRSGAGSGGLITPDSGNLVLDGIAVAFNILQVASVAFDIGDKIENAKFSDTLLYTINKYKIIEKDKEQKGYMNTAIKKNYNINVYKSSVIEKLSSMVSSNLIEYRFKKEKTKKTKI